MFLSVLSFFVSPVGRVIAIILALALPLGRCGTVAHARSAMNFHNRPAQISYDESG